MQKLVSRDNHGQNVWEKSQVYMWNGALQGNVNFYFSVVFC